MSSVPPFNDKDERELWSDIGNDHYIRYCEYKDDTRAGMRVLHLTKEFKRCEGFISFEGGRWHELFPQSPAWRVESWGPLTLSPSLLCRNCGDHGYIRSGKWECCP